MIFMMGDFKELMGLFWTNGYKTTIDPGDDYDAIITTASLCQAVPENTGKPTVVKLFHRISDIKARRHLPEARYAYSNDEIIGHLEKIQAEKIQRRQVNE